MNAGTEDTSFAIPKAPGGRPWRLVMDTTRPSPEDIYEPGEEPVLQWAPEYVVGERSFVLLRA